MHRNKDVILGEDGYTNRSDDAPRNIFSLIALKILKSVSPRQPAPSNNFRTTGTRPFACSQVEPLAFLLNRPADRRIGIARIHPKWQY